MQIRLMTKDDAQAVADVLNHAIGSGVAHFGTVPTSADEVLNDWRSTAEMHPWIVATSDDLDSEHKDSGQFIGFAKASEWKTRKAYKWTVETGIYLIEGAQGKGAGKALYLKLFELLTRQGYCIALAGVSVPNEASERLHDSIGMSIVGDIAPAGFKLGKWVPVRIYQKHLGDMSAGTIPGGIRAVQGVWDEMHKPETSTQNLPTT